LEVIMSDKKSRTGLRLVDLAEFATRPTVQWAIRGILPRDTLALVFGPPKEGKTFAVVDMLLHAAHGLDWHGHAIRRPQRVAFLSGEGQTGLRVRLHAWTQYHDSAELQGAFNVLPVSLALPDRIEELIELLRDFKPDIIAIDTLNAYFGGGDENSTHDMTRFVTELRRLREALSCIILIIHHTGLTNTDRERGSIALRGAVDVVIRVSKERSSSGGLGFQVILGRDVEPMDAPLALRLRPVETDWQDEDGIPLKTCIVETADQPIKAGEQKARLLGAAQRTVLAIAHELAAHGVPDESGWVGLSRAQIASCAKERGVSRQSLSSALHSLDGHDRIRLTESETILVRISASTTNRRDTPTSGAPPPLPLIALAHEQGHVGTPRPKSES